MLVIGIYSHVRAAASQKETLPPFTRSLLPAAGAATNQTGLKGPQKARKAGISLFQKGISGGQGWGGSGAGKGVEVG
jgi:hypothetical protein